eukprot:1348573-Amorphochlora_amoeboformis.AAC.1
MLNGNKNEWNIASGVAGTRTCRDGLQYLAGVRVIGLRGVWLREGLVMTIFFSKMASVEYERQKAMQPPNFEYGGTDYESPPNTHIQSSLFGIYLSKLVLRDAGSHNLHVLHGGSPSHPTVRCRVFQKYNLLHVHTPDFQTYGAFWPR